MERKGCMKNVCRQLCVVGVLSMFFFGSCIDKNNNKSPTNSSPDIVTIPDEVTPTPKPTPRPPSDVLIIVDKNYDDAIPAPCGTEQTVCKSISDGLFSAAKFQDGIPTVLVKPGIYDEEPAYPIHILVPVILKAEHSHETIVKTPHQHRAFDIGASDVMIEGVKIISDGSPVIKVSKEGYATLNSIRMEIDSPPTTCRDSVSVDEGAAAVIEHNELHSSVSSSGRLTVNNSIIFPAYGCSGEFRIWNGQAILKNNTLYSQSEYDVSLDMYQASKTNMEFQGNTVYGVAKIRTGNANLEGNTFARGIQLSGATVTLRDNLIHNISYGRYNALRVEDSTVSISSNRLDSELDGTNIIECEEGTVIQSDGTNSLLNPNCMIACEGLPSTPGAELF